MINRKELFFELLSTELFKEGFEFKRAKSQFIKKDEYGNELYYDFNIWPQFMKIEAGFRIFIYEVEAIKKKAWGKSYRKFESLGKEKSYLAPNPSEGHSWTDTEANVRLAVKKEIEFYHSVVKDYFKKHVDLEYLDSILNTIPGSELYVAHNAIYSSFLAIVVAKLVGHSNLNDLFPVYRKIVEKFNFAFLEEYDLLQNYLIQS